MPIYVVAGSYLEYQEFIAARYLTINRLDTVWAGRTVADRGLRLN